MPFFKTFTNTFSFKKGAFFITAFFWIFVILFLAIRVFVFLKLNLGYIDSDQAFMWMGASDYARGLFYEPRFYAQDYNTFMEALFAVPFIWMNVPVYYAVPLATHIIFSTPFIFTAFYLFFNRRKIQALMVLTIVLCLPAEYDLMNSLPRGFVTGLFFTSFFVVNMLNPNNLKFFIFNVIFCMIGYFVNPNSVIVSVPFLFYVYLHHFKNKRFYLINLPLAFLLIPLYLFFNHFYVVHPDYIKHGLEYRLSTAFFWHNLREIDLRFIHISFFKEKSFLTILFSLVFLAYFLYRQNKNAAWAYIAFIVVILFSFCTGKTLEGSTWAYMSFSRMYLGIPVFMCLFLSVLNIKTNPLTLSLMLVPLVFSGYKMVSFERTLEPHYKNELWVGVRLIKFDDGLNAIKYYGEVCQKNKAPFLLISKDFWLNTFLAYGGPALYTNYPLTQETKADKRYWVREGLKNKVFDRFVIISEEFNLDKRLPKSVNFEIQRLDDYGMFLVKNNHVSVNAFAGLMNAFEPRP
jgi:hypothetical protein